MVGTLRTQAGLLEKHMTSLFRKISIFYVRRRFDKEVFIEFIFIVSELLVLNAFLILKAIRTRNQ